MDIIRRNTDYALRAMVYLAEHYNSQKACSSRQVSKNEDIPYMLACKLMQKLHQGGLVTSSMGKKGGFSITQSPDKIPLLAIIQAVQGPLKLNRCLLGENACAREPFCPISKKLANLQNHIDDSLGKITLTDFLPANPQTDKSRKSTSEKMSPYSDNTRKLLIKEMKQVFGSDTKRINHALSVLNYAEQIQKLEGGNLAIIEAAAILHDIGIHQAEQKNNSSAGRYQEIEGPPIAKAILVKYGFADEAVEHICKIIANHHSGKNIDTIEFRTIWDADWLVNIPDEFPAAEREKMRKLIDKIFRTDKGRKLAIKLFLEK